MREYAGGMKAIGLPARVAYAGTAFVLSGTAVFYIGMNWLPEYATTYPELDAGGAGYGIFKTAVCIAAWIALTVSLPALTLPGVRRRKLRGRGTRMAFTGVVVVTASLVFADEGFRLIYSLLFATWLAYVMAFTFVRYGVIDDVRRSSTSANSY
jgi:hypothetical protein